MAKGARGQARRALIKEGWYKEALEVFAQAERSFHAPTVVIYEARCSEKLGWLRQAQSRYQEILDEKYTGDSPQEFRAAQEQARAELEEPRRGTPHDDLQ